MAYRKSLNWMKRKMWKSILSSFFVLVLSGCVSTLSGTFRTGKHGDPPPQQLFVVIQSDFLSLTEMNIVRLIEIKMIRRGYVRANSPETATIAVYYKYSIGQAQMDFTNAPDFVFGGQEAEFSTHYPLYFQIIVADIERSKANKIEKIWQGEVYISGSTADSSTLASYFIDVLFDNFDTTVANQTRTIKQAVVPW